MDLEQRGIGVVARFFEAFATLAAEHSILKWRILAVSTGATSTTNAMAYGVSARSLWRGSRQYATNTKYLPNGFCSAKARCLTNKKEAE